ncbi:MAG: L,D-transpeptidase family protein [Myxococcota bacterium]
MSSPKIVSRPRIRRAGPSRPPVAYRARRRLLALGRLAPCASPPRLHATRPLAPLVRITLALVPLALLVRSTPARAAPRDEAVPTLPDTTVAVGLAPVVGRAQVEIIAPGDTLLDVAERHRLGFERVARLNPEVDPWIPKPGTRVRLPTRSVLPDAPHDGLVVNLPELQLYDYGVDREDPAVLALAIGDELDPSLIGRFRIGRKRADPVWHVPTSIREERPDLPAEVPAGPDNPLGPYWLTIGETSYGLHGTNNRWSIGREATHGCLRMYNDVVGRLFERTPTGTPIRLVYQTVKFGLETGIVYVEAHPDRYRRDPDRLERAHAQLRLLGLDDDESLARLDAVIEAARGEPVAIGVLPEDGTPIDELTSRPTS